jgi:TonB family protein
VLPPSSAQGNRKTGRTRGQWGDPKPLYGVMSRGSGSGGGMGSGIGTGAGSGRGTGMGSGSGSGSGSPPPAAPSVNATTSASPPDATRSISGGIVNGKAVSLPKPAYPAAASAVNATGAVSVQVTIDESGKVISSRPVSGHPLLRAAAKTAASTAKFVPTMMSGQPVKVMGIITYNFVGPNRPATVSRSLSRPRVIETAAAPPPPPSPAKLRRQRLKEKLHTWLYGVVIRLRTGKTKPGPNESTFVQQRKASIQILLNDNSPETLRKLKALGFDAAPGQDGTTVSGTIALEKLAALVEMEQVKLVLPIT